MDTQTLKLLIQIKFRIAATKSDSEITQINQELSYLLAESIVKIEALKEIQKARHLILVKAKS